MGAARRIVVVADDLGCSKGTVEGIAIAARAGFVREASVMATGLAVEQGIEACADLGLGLHLCLTQGRSLSGRIRGLTDRQGAFLGLRRALTAAWARRIDRGDLRREIEAQFDRLERLGVRPTHVNGHHHAHCFPIVRDVLAEIAEAHGVRWTRLPDDLIARGCAAFLLRRLAIGARRGMSERGLRSHPFLGLSLETRLDHRARFAAAIASLAAGDYELMVHPRVPEEDFARLDPAGGRRDEAARAELATLTDEGLLRELRASGVRIARFAEIRGA
ncbi:MAG: hypothetical protein Fur0037_22580 [Planctomycetota bacterium]